ncbi:hypothetical protein F7Q99_36135 [Streptomyces kaniharaensis]|uniref:Uncharacterized protein n=1 Tax=Streptomyces kaniharaensis TaxID=212423 RepID=A0A6N7L0V2_9ACTN|nr:hypothetical protein [Streptomyces kaniharaensis]MQS17472.1 hypothetical protein [Streptomyces kaniharaensis]
MTAYRILGTTDENTTCDHCGRKDLKHTVVFDIADAEGNPTGELFYAGSSCATTLPGLQHLSAATIRQRARSAQLAADVRAAQEREWAGEILAKYGPVEHRGAGLKSAVLFGYNPHGRERVTSVSGEVAGLLAEARRILGDAPAPVTLKTKELGRMTAGFMAAFLKRNPGYRF